LEKIRQKKVRTDFSEENLLQLFEHSHPKLPSLQENLPAALLLELVLVLAESGPGSRGCCVLQRSLSSVKQEGSRNIGETQVQSTYEIHKLCSVVAKNSSNHSVEQGKYSYA